MFLNSYQKMKKVRENFIFSTIEILQNNLEYILILGGHKVFLNKVRKKLFSVNKKIYAVEINDDYISELKENPENIVVKADLNEKIPFQKDKPSVLIAHTIKAKGLSFMEDKLESHYRPPTEEEYKIAIKELKKI